MSSKQEILKLKQSAMPAIVFVAIIALVKIIEFSFNLNLHFLANHPRHSDGILGIFTMPLLHGDFKHLFNNSAPILVLGTFLFYFYKSVADKVLLIIWLLSGILVWLFARPNYHLGASGVVYGLAAFLFFSGLFRKDVRAIAISFIVALFYGGMVWGVLPLQKGVSWEGHLFGAFAGLFAAIIFKDVNKVAPHPYEIEEIDYEKKEYWKNFVDE